MKHTTQLPYIAIGNGERCPFCAEILDGNQWEHLKDKHEKELITALFPREKG